MWAGEGGLVYFLNFIRAFGTDSFTRPETALSRPTELVAQVLTSTVRWGKFKVDGSI